MTEDMKVRIASTFMQMSQKKNIDKITVKDLVDNCGVSRQTFYYHFKDILEVMEWSVTQIIKKAEQSSIEEKNPKKAIEEFIRVPMEYRDILNRLLTSQNHTQVEKIFLEAVRSSICEMIRSKNLDTDVDFQDMQVILNFYSYGIMGVIFESCGESDTDAAKLSEKLYRLISGDMLDFR